MAPGAAKHGNANLLSTSDQPPPMFGTVEPKLYRSAYPTVAHVSYIVNKLNVKTILLLSIEGLPLPVIEKFKEAPSPPVVTHVTRAAWAKREEICTGLVKDALQFMLDASTHPLLVMCPTGTLQTNAVVGCLRRIERWCMSSILAEAELYAPRAKFVLQRVASFVEDYSPDAVPVLDATRRQGSMKVVCGPEQSEDNDSFTTTSNENRSGPSLPPPGPNESPMKFPSAPIGAPSAFDLGPAVTSDALRQLPFPTWWRSYLLAWEEDYLAMTQASRGEAVEPLGDSLSSSKHTCVHDEYRFSRNPPAVGPLTKFTKDSLVEEDDD